MLKIFYDNLIPIPQQIKILPGSGKSPERIKLVTHKLDGEIANDFPRLAKIVLNKWLKQNTRLCLTVEVRLKPDFVLSGGRRIPGSLKKEAYELIMGKKAVLTAQHYRGIQRGIQTLKQVLENAAQCGTMPYCRIADWPRIAIRGIHFDLAREMEYRPAFLRKVVERVAYFKMNTLHLYLENKFVYPSCPQVAPARVMNRKQAQELCRYAKIFGVTIIPQISTMGHVEHFLNNDLAFLREDPESSFNLCPSHPESRPFLAGLIRDVAEAFQSPYIHVGYDESDSGICPRCRKKGPASDILAGHLNWLNNEVKKHGAQTMIYGDKFLSRHEFPRADAVHGGSIEQVHAALDQVDRDIIITDWHYTAPYGGTTRYLVKAGFEVHIASGSNIYWHDAIPLTRGHHWIVNTLDQGIKNGAVGAFNTNWEFYRGQFFDNFWFFQALAAERQWSEHKHDYLTYGMRFSSRFWGVENDYYSDLATLTEATSSRRRSLFLDSHVLAELPSRFRSDYAEIGDYISKQTQTLRRKALRNRDTLRLLEMPGDIVKYLGARAFQSYVIELAMAAGRKEQVIKALRAIGESAGKVADGLELGYRIYGGAVEDRKRIKIHIDSIERIIKRVRNLKSQELREMSVKDLPAM